METTVYRVSGYVGIMERKWKLLFIGFRVIQG